MQTFHLGRSVVGAWKRLEGWLSRQLSGLEAQAVPATLLRAEFSDRPDRRGAFFGSLLNTPDTRGLG